MYSKANVADIAALVFAIMLAGVTLPASAIVIGPAADCATAANCHPGGDTGSGTFVDQTASAALGAGTYDVTEFEAIFGKAGVGVRPFLATTADGGLTYSSIWVGPDVAALGAMTSTNPYVLGTQQFILAVGQSVFAGFQNTAGGASPVSFTMSAGSTDIDAPGLGDNITAAGQTIDANNQNLTRIYDFSITVQRATVPEPGTLVLLGLGLAGLGFLRRKARVI